MSSNWGGFSLRSALERASRGVILRRRLPRELGGHRVLVSPDSSLHFWLPRIYRRDGMLVEVSRQLVRDGDVVWDIGANVGLFSFAAAFFCGRSGHVLALEPDPWLAALIRRSGADLPASFASIEVRELAVSNHEATLDFSIGRRGRAASHLSAVNGSSQSGGTREVIRVQATTLDRLIDTSRPPSMVKIDVEGAELLCLRAAERLLASVKPIVLCEVGATTRDAVGSILRSAGYQLFNADRLQEHSPPLESPTWNTVAVPRELQLE